MSSNQDTSGTSSFLVGPNNTHQHVVTVTEGTDATDRVYATCVIHLTSEANQNGATFPLTILAHGARGNIAASLGTLFSNQQKIAGPWDSDCCSCWISQGGGVRMWKLRSVLDGFLPRETYIPNSFRVRCASADHGANSLQEHHLTIDMGYLAVNDHIGVPVTRFSYFDTRTGELASTLLLSEWVDRSLFSQAFKKCLQLDPGAPCILETLQQTPIVGRILGSTDDFNTYGWEGVSEALREYAGATSVTGKVSICSDNHICFPTGCATPMSVLRAAEGKWVDVTVGLKEA